jgi:hypothetical protein
MGVAARWSENDPRLMKESQRQVENRITAVIFFGDPRSCVKQETENINIFTVSVFIIIFHLATFSGNKWRKLFFSFV